MNKVKQLRNAKGWSQVKLAVNADVSLGTIQAIENGSANPTLSVMQKVARALEVEVAELLSEESVA
jgi:transcriptional regulator with XRE-family HTH domain